MNSLSDQQLLREYTERRSEPAFAELVRRYVDLVYSAALRMVRDVHLAEDVTQSVFVALARHARQLADHPVLAGWLHRTTQNLAANTVRSDVRRRIREQKAAAMNALISIEPDAVWEQIAPHLDAALGELSELDHAALLLRYFQNKSAREMAQILGTTEDTAQKRVSRAVDRLRELFSKRGVTVSASGLVVVIAANAVQAAPAGLAATISSAAVLAGTTVATAATATITKAIAMTTLQKIVIAITIVAAVSTGIYEARQALILRSEVESLTEQNAALVAQSQSWLTASNELATLAAKRVNGDADSAELAKLRGEVSKLREGYDAVAAELKTTKDFQSRVMQLYSNAPPARTFVATASVTIPWDQAIVTGGWKTPFGRRNILLLRLRRMEAPDQMMIETVVLEYSEAAGDALGLAQYNVEGQSTSRTHDLSGDEFEALLKASRQNEGVTVLATPVVTTATGQHARIEATQTRATSAGEPYTIKQVLDCIPTGSSYGESVQMLIVAQLNYSLEGTLTLIAP